MRPNTTAFNATLELMAEDLGRCAVMAIRGIAIFDRRGDTAYGDDLQLDAVEYARAAAHCANIMFKRQDESSYVAAA